MFLADFSVRWHLDALFFCEIILKHKIYSETLLSLTFDIGTVDG